MGRLLGRNRHAQWGSAVALTAKKKPQMSYRKLWSSALAETWVLAHKNENIYLNWDAAARRNVKIFDLAHEAANAALTLPQFAAAFTEDDLKANRVPPDGISQRVVRSYFPGRSGDVFLVPKPYYVATDKTTGHGTPYSYDTNVPVILCGAFFKP